ncbi:MAG: N-acetylneuraminate synthase family protein [Deltaproteobacteria bacterium]|nr:N-acetylneuraminate synthase family protein [Deltaproteobacteria bacterium]
MKIQNHTIGIGQPSFIIAEVAQAHDGSLGQAHAYIEAAAQAGVDAVKFQTHIAEAESTLDEPFRVRFSLQDATRYDYWSRMEFTFEQWQGLAEHAREKKLVFLSSPFSVQAVEMLEKLSVSAWKIGSGETFSDDILRTVLKTGKPVLVSTGMSTFQEIDNLTRRLNTKKIPFALFQCTSKYPVDFSEVGLNIIQEMKERYCCPVGLSDHSGSIFSVLAAIAQGADIIEAHIVFDKKMFGPDTPASLTVEDFKMLTRAREAFHQMNANPVDKDKMSESMRQMRSMFGKSLATVKDLPAGSILTNEMLTAKKPGTGIPFGQKSKLIGNILKNDVSSNRLIRWEDISE